MISSPQMPLVPQPFVSTDRSPMKSDEGSTADDSDPQDLLASSQDEMAPAPWKLPSTGLLPQAESFDFPQVNPVHPVPAYIMNAEGVHDPQRATQWLQSEMQELVDMMCRREAEMHQLEWQLSALGANAAPVLPIQNPVQRGRLDAQIFNL